MAVDACVVVAVSVPVADDRNVSRRAVWAGDDVATNASEVIRDVEGSSVECVEANGGFVDWCADFDLVVFAEVEGGDPVEGAFHSVAVGVVESGEVSA